MNPRLRTGILIGLGVLLIAAALYLMFFRRAPAAPEVETPVQEQPGPSNGLTGAPTTPSSTTTLANPLMPEPQEPAAADERLIVRQNAEIFAERYGSYSNQGDYQNLRDLLPLMTARYHAETEAFLAERSGQPPATTYEGVTSAKLSSALDTYDEDSGTATATVQLQQTKTVGTSTSVSYVHLVLDLREEGGEWKIDSAVWRQ